MKINKLILGACAALVLASCGGGEKPADPKTSTPPEATSQPAPVTSEEKPVSTSEEKPASSEEKTSSEQKTSSEEKPSSEEKSSSEEKTSSSEDKPASSDPAGEDGPRETDGHTEPKKDDAGFYVFEAECVDLDDFVGAGYSGGAQMAGAICTDWDGSGKASDGLFISYMYVTDLSIWFDIWADEDADAEFKMRLSGEVLEGVVFDDDMFTVTCNGTKVSYDEIAIGPCNTDLSTDWIKEFEDFPVNDTLKLKKGKNTIELMTTNEEPMAGTMYATAPMIDCIKLKTTTKLAWDPIENKKPYKA